MDKKETFRFSKQDFKRGLVDGIPIATGYFSVAFTFGMMAIEAGMTWWQALLISFLNLTSAGQFAGLNLMIAAGSYFEMALTQFVINIRYCLMSLALTQKLEKHFTTPWRMLCGFANTDEIFAVSATNKSVSVSYFLGLMLLPIIGWNGGTLAGAICGNILPTIVCDALGLAIYGMFIAILMPAIKKETGALMVVVIAVVCSCLIYYLPMFDFITSGFSVIICAVIAAVAGAILWPVEDEEESGKAEV